jgi:hypothetical protein
MKHVIYLFLVHVAHSWKIYHTLNWQTKIWSIRVNQLVHTSEQIFGLQKKLKDHYNEIKFLTLTVKRIIYLAGKMCMTAICFTRNFQVILLRVNQLVYIVNKVYVINEYMVICKLLEKEKGRMTAMCFTRNFVKNDFHIQCIT